MMRFNHLARLSLALCLLLSHATTPAYAVVAQGHIPDPNDPAAEASPTSYTQGYFYTVQPTDTLWDIAAAHKLSLTDLIAANAAVHPNRLQPGQSIFVPAEPALIPRRTVTPAPPVPTTAARPAASPVQPAPGAWQAELLALMNAQRVAAGRPALIWSPELARAAQAHADDCAARNWISHVGSDGAVLRTRLARIGYAATWAGENSANYRTVQQTFAMWWDEPPGADPHRANILQPQYREVGIGIAAGGWGYYFIADFGAR